VAKPRRFAHHSCLEGGQLRTYWEPTLGDKVSLGKRGCWCQGGLGFGDALTRPVHLVYELVLGSCCEGGFGSERGAGCEAEGEEEAAGAGGERVRGLACVHGGALTRHAGGELELDGVAGRSGRQLGKQYGVGSQRFV
jgi:hypothetical protein